MYVSTLTISESHGQEEADHAQQKSELFITTLKFGNAVARYHHESYRLVIKDTQCSNYIEPVMYIDTLISQCFLKVYKEIVPRELGGWKEGWGGGKKSLPK